MDGRTMCWTKGMNRRVVKPPPKVNPQLPSQAPLTQHPTYPSQESHYPGNSNGGDLDTNDPEFEAMVQQQMEILRANISTYSQMNDFEVPQKHFDYPPEYSRQDYPTNSFDHPKVMYEPSDPYPGLFDSSTNHSLSPRRTKGSLHDLYGPDDDRQNLKAAKAAAYSHQVLAFYLFISYLPVGTSKTISTTS